jgi:hypothetical protein
VDIDPIDWEMVIVPVFDLRGNVMAVLELVASPFSPKLKYPGTRGRILLDQAAQWLAHQLSSPLQHILGFVDGPTTRPYSIPRRYNC